MLTGQTTLNALSALQVTSSPMPDVFCHIHVKFNDPLQKPYMLSQLPHLPVKLSSLLSKAAPHQPDLFYSIN